MKKMVGLLCALIFSSALLFAEVNYQGDLALNLGVGFGKATMNDSSTGLNLDPLKQTTFDVGFESWNFFKPADVFGVGFMAGIYGGIGKTKPLDIFSAYGVDVPSGLASNAGFSIGPAVAYYAGEKLRFAGTFGFNVGINVDTPADRQDFDAGNVEVYMACGALPYIGFSGELQAQYNIFKKNNLVVGYRFVNGFSNKTKISETIKEDNNEYFDISDDFDYKYVFRKHSIFVGYSCSF